MNQLYLVRHGHANYGLDCLTDLGIQQVNMLGKKLERKFLSGVGYAIATSPSGRAVETANILVPFIPNKSRLSIRLYNDPVFGELEESTFGLVTPHTTGRGEESTTKIKEYLGGTDVILVIAHSRLIGSTCQAIASHYNIELPENLRMQESVEEVLIGFIMESENVGREEAIKRILERGRTEKTLPRIGNANAVFFDLDQMIAELIVPN